MLETIKYLKNHTYEDLENEFGIKVKLYDDRVVLNYSQIESPKHHPIVKECRALILSVPEHKILSKAFDRFFNYGEDPNSNKFDINKATVDEKIDGSLMPVYHDGKQWQVATRGTAFAEGEVPIQNGKTFRDVFIEAINGEPNNIFEHIDKDLVIIFELVSPETRVVKPYEKSEVYLLEVMDKTMGIFHGRESTYYWNIPFGTKWKYPKKYKFENWDDCIKASKELIAFDEGYVAVHGNWRIKVKSPSYLAISNLRMNGAMSEKRIIILVLGNDHEEYLNYFPEDKEIFKPYIDAFEKMILEIDKYWVQYKDIEDQKDFAMSIKDCHAKHILFNMKNKSMMIEDIINNMTDNTKINLLKGYM